VKSGIDTILNTGSDILEEAKEAGVGSHAEATRSKELGKLHSLTDFSGHLAVSTLRQFSLFLSSITVLAVDYNI
jgi:hypothetical protein